MTFRDEGELYRAIKTGKAEGKSFREVAAEIGVSAARAHKVFHRGYSMDRLGAPILRPSEIPVFIFEPEERRRLRNAAKKRDLSLQQLVQLVVETVAQNNLFDAVLDDGGDE